MLCKIIARAIDITTDPLTIDLPTLHNIKCQIHRVVKEGFLRREDPIQQTNDILAISLKGDPSGG